MMIYGLFLNSGVLGSLGLGQDSFEGSEGVVSCAQERKRRLRGSVRSCEGSTRILSCMFLRISLTEVIRALNPKP